MSTYVHIYTGFEQKTLASLSTMINAFAWLCLICTQNVKGIELGLSSQTCFFNSYRFLLRARCYYLP